MADKMRWKHGDTNSVDAAVDAETVIKIGDMVYQDIDDAKPASMIKSWSCDSIANPGAMVSPGTLQAQFAGKFLGVAMQRSYPGDTDPVRVATTGVFEFDCPSSTFELGDKMGADANADGLLSQQVTWVGASEYAIGRVAKRESVATTTVLVDIRSTVMTGGIKGTTP